MPESAGRVKKMRVAHEETVSYFLRLDDGELPLNPALGQQISMVFDGVIECSACGRITKKSYSQGHCFPCSQRLASCDLCIVRPQTCHFHEGTCREPDWGEANCMRPHIVYLANSSALKVGITRANQLPTRWIDQGAVAALPLFTTSSRRIAGFLEVTIGAHVGDRTDWRRMLKGDPEPRVLAEARDELLGRCNREIDAVRSEFGADAFRASGSDEELRFRYPVIEYPDKVRSLTFDKHARIEGTLVGIKGQYLMLDTGVVNMRRHSGYRISAQLP